MARKRDVSTEFVVSNEFILWAESLAGLLTKVDTTFGGVSKMLESPHWDKGRTNYAIEIIARLKGQIHKIHTEMSEHEEGRMY